MEKQRFKALVAVHLLIHKEEKILLQLREGTGWADGQYSVIAGHLDGNESVKVGMAREAFEEIGIEIHPKDLQTTCVMHRKTEDREVIDFFFTTKKWKNEITNKEPHKCKELVFYPVLQLPTNIVGYVKHAIEAIENHKRFVEYGW